MGDVLIIPIPEEVDGDASRGGESNFALLGDRGPDSFEPSDKIPDSSPKINFYHGEMIFWAHLVFFVQIMCLMGTLMIYKLSMKVGKMKIVSHFTYHDGKSHAEFFIIDR